MLPGQRSSAASGHQPIGVFLRQYDVLSPDWQPSFHQCQRILDFAVMCAAQALRSFLRSFPDTRAKFFVRVYCRSHVHCKALAASVDQGSHAVKTALRPSYNSSNFSNSPQRFESSHCLFKVTRSKGTIATHITYSNKNINGTISIFGIPFRYPILFGLQTCINERIMYHTTTQNIENTANQDTNHDCYAHESNVRTLNSSGSDFNYCKLDERHLDSHKPQSPTEVAPSESKIVLQKDVPLSDFSTLRRGNVNKDDDTCGTGVNAETDFYKLIETEDNPAELLSMLMKLEQVFPSSDMKVCRTCLRLANLLNDRNETPEKVLDYARQAFHNISPSKFPFESAKAHFLVGVGHYKMGEPIEAMIALEKCVSDIERAQLHRSAEKQEFAILKHSVQIVLGQSKLSRGLYAEGLLELRKSLTAVENESCLEKRCLASFYQGTASALLQANEPSEALKICRKAFPAYVKYFGTDSLEIVELRSLMMQIHYNMKDYKNVIYQCQLAVQSLDKLGDKDKAIGLKLESMQAYFLLGKFNEAVKKLNDIVEGTQEEDPYHIEALILLVRAFIGLGNVAAATEHSKRALNVLEKKELDLDSAKSLVRLSSAYEQMQNYDEALSVLQRGLESLESCAGEEAAACTADAEGYKGSLLLSIGRYDQAIHHLERAMIMKKTIRGSDIGELLDVCNQLGVAYVRLERVDQALTVFQEGKTILDAKKCTHNLTSIQICNNLSHLCSISGRIEEAIESKKLAVQLAKQAGKEVLFAVSVLEQELEDLMLAKDQGNGSSKIEIDTNT
ncbi:hypothetical protein KP509_05G009500 [Ceratopteris richardii]|uniref:Uncharacterized protein n=1 Tax=Ceratopteris richardii TaxID=49495 RepID=A0A8T2UR44_CERRI|nr:hypothetical protein KP509_05G009500 [Ceratopteris richardii]